MIENNFPVSCECKFILYLLGLVVLLLAFSCKEDDETNTEATARSFATEEIISLTNAAGDTIYTGPRYNRQFQALVQEFLIDMNDLDIYDSSYFNIDSTNTDHFYEDIGHYSKYVFGWVDWYFRFSADESGNFQVPIWLFDGPLDDPLSRWIGNYPLWGPDTDLSIAPNAREASPMRTTFNELGK